MHFYKMNTFNFKGFTLIEVLIVVAIIALLTSISIPYYNFYSNRAKFSEVILATSLYKNSIEIAFSTTPSPDLSKFDGGEYGIPVNNSLLVVPHKYIVATNVENGVIKVESNISYQGTNTTYILSPNVVNNRLSWNTSGTCTEAGYC